MVPVPGPSAPFPSPLSVRIRKASPDDFARIHGLSALVPPALAQAIANGTASAALDAAEQGTQCFHEVLATAHARGYTAAVNAVSSVLIATDLKGRQAVLVAQPAVEPFSEPGSFSGPLQLERLTLVFAAEITAITAPESSELGAALLHAAADTYSRAGFAILYGTAAAPARSIAPAPFRTTGAGKALCLDPAFLKHSIGLATVAPPAGTLIYYADLQGQAEAEADWEYPIGPGEDRPSTELPSTELPSRERSEAPDLRLHWTPGLAFGS